MKRVLEDLIEMDDELYSYYEGEKFTGISFELWDNGQLGSETTYVDGIETGLQKIWYKNGQLEKEIYLRNASGHGMEREWYENGKLKLESEIWKGICMWEKLWDENGNLTKDYKIKETDLLYPKDYTGIYSTEAK
jgi:antitoxin component YwqK of YwqJK toxin-antitoxin module